MGKFMEENGIQLLLRHHTQGQRPQPEAENAPHHTNARTGQGHHIQPHRPLPAGLLRCPASQGIEPGIVLLRQEPIYFLQKGLGRRQENLLGSSRHQKCRPEHPGDSEGIRLIEVAGEDRKGQAQQEQQACIHIGCQADEPELTQFPLCRLLRLSPVRLHESIGLGHTHPLKTLFLQRHGKHRHQRQHHQAQQITHAADPFCPAGDPGIILLPKEDSPDLGGKGNQQWHPQKDGAHSFANLLRFGQGNRLHLRHGAAHFPAHHAGGNKHRDHGEKFHHREADHDLFVPLGEVRRLPAPGEGHRQENPDKHQYHSNEQYPQPSLLHLHSSKRRRFPGKLLFIAPFRRAGS